MDLRKRCKAKSKRSGQQCKQFVIPGYEVCYYHGAGGGPPKHNKNAMTHGAYVNKLLDEEEKMLFDEYFQKLNEDFVLNSSSDRMSAELACLYFVRWIRAVKGGNAEAMYKIDSLLRNQLKDLKATKDKREGDTINLNTTPAEWAANLLERVRKARAEKK
jgi:hypothetical protein